MDVQPDDLQISGEGEGPLQVKDETESRFHLSQGWRIQSPAKVPEVATINCHQLRYVGHRVLR